MFKYALGRELNSMRSGAKVAVVGGVFVVVAGGVGYGGYNLWNGLSGNGGGTTTKSAETKKSGPVTPDEVKQTAEEFLAAWAAGESDKAAQLTNNSGAAGTAVEGFRSQAHVSKAVITPGTPSGVRVPFTVAATVTYQGVSKPLNYTSSLTVVRGLTTGKALVDWQPAVIHPKLTKTATLKTGAAKTAEIKAVDHDGVELTKEKYPSLGPILDELRKRYGAKTTGTPGVETFIDSGSDSVANTSLVTLTKGKPGELKTTLDAGVQAAAEKAVKRYGKASVVAIKPSTGEVRAIANSPADGYNTAFMGSQAPGSTMKIVTAAMMMDQGIVSGPNAKVECPATVSWEGVPFRNLDHFKIDNGTFEASFRRSCNTAFIKAIGPLNEKGIENTALGDTARKYFGIGVEWNTGIPSFDGKVPPSQGGETAASYIGQGKIQMSALNVASIAATAKSGAFKQPVVVPQSLDDRELATAQPLPGHISQSLKQMMRATATASDGTGRQAMAGLGGSKGAKTGSAEVDNQATSNSWFTGYADDLAAAAVVQSGGHGGDAAGPVVASVLKAR